MPPLEQSYSSRLSNYLPATPLSKSLARKKEKRKRQKEVSHPLLSPEPTSWDSNEQEAENDGTLSNSLPSVPLLMEDNKENKEEEGNSPPLCQPKKSVSFFPKVKCHYIKSHKVLSKKKKKILWYSRDETAKVRNDAIDTVRKMALGGSLGPGETSRGLENKTPREFRPRVKEIRDILGFVLEEQSRFFTPVSLLGGDELMSDDESQEMDGPASTFTNDEYLAAVYRYYNKKHTVEAITLAAIDAQEVYGAQ